MSVLSQLKALPKENWVFCAAIFINRLGSMALVFLILYLHTHLGYSLPLAGFIFAMYGVGAILGGLWGGWLSDRFGAIRVMVISLFINAVLLLIYPFIHPVLIIVILTLCWALASEVFRPANMAAVVQYCDARDRRLAYAVNRAGINLGMSVGPVVGGVIAHYHFKWVFILNGLSVIVAAGILMAYFYRDFCHVVRVVHVPMWCALRIACRDRLLRYALILNGLISLIFYQTDATLPVFVVHNLGMSTAVFGFLFTVNTVLIVLFEVILNISTRAWRITSVLALGCLAISIGFGLGAWTTVLWELILTVVIWTVGEMLFYPAISTYVADIASSEKRGTYLGLFTMSTNVALTLGPFVGTQVMAGWGAHVLWMSCLMFGLCVTVFSLYLPPVPVTERRSA